MRAAAIGAGVALALLVGLAAGWLRWRDPVAALPREAAAPLRAVEEQVERRRGRLITYVTLEGSAVGSIRFSVSLPHPMPRGRVPVMVALGGRRTPAGTVWDLGDPGPNAVILYEFPPPPGNRWGRHVAWRAPELYGLVLSLPGQVDALLRWASEQPWADRERVSLMGYSLGALVAPAAQRLVEERGASVGWTVLAYGGAPIAAVLEAQPWASSSWFRPIIRPAAWLLLRPLEPATHLPEIQGEFLVLGGSADPNVPPEAGERLRELTPPPRTVILLEGEHVGTEPEKRKVLLAAVAASLSWLAEQGAIEPPGAPFRSGQLH
jgi:hypothetical protein